MAEVMTAKARTALVTVLTAAAPHWGQDPAKLRFLSGQPLQNTDLPGIVITFPTVRVRPTGIGGLTGVEAGAAPQSLLSLRLEGTVRFDIWVARDSNGAPSLQQTEEITRYLSEALAMNEVPLRQGGVLRFRQTGMGRVEKAEEMASWIFRGQGFHSELTGELLFEASFPPAVVEGVIKSIHVTMNDPGSAKFVVK